MQKVPVQPGLHAKHVAYGVFTVNRTRKVTLNSINAMFTTALSKFPQKQIIDMVHKRNNI